MKSHNPFSINFDQQKLNAKRRLKSIRNNDLEVLSQVKSFHTQPNTLSKETVQLADVQFALARELGLPSWAKLKAHCFDLSLQKTELSNRNIALDSDISTLHIRCGHDIQNRLKNSGFAGEYLALIDPLCIGPIPSNEKHFVAIRAQYVKETLLPIAGRSDSVQQIAEAEQGNIDMLFDRRFKRLVFWVEHDAYDQLMLLRCLTLLAGNSNKTIEIVELNSFPGSQRFIGLGQLPEEAFRLCWQQRKRISGKLETQALRCWKALVSSNPNTLVEMIEEDGLDCLPNMKNVLTRMLQELPHCETGLSLTQHLALKVLQNKKDKLTVKEWFVEYQKQEPLPFLGDMMFFALLLPLAHLDKPLISCESLHKPWREQTFLLTDKGHLILANRARVEQEYWVGSIQVRSNGTWSWDHSDFGSLVYFP
ncbi:DUF1835 domain-containing protein [Alteromonas sp. 5E99-2]|uniref:DUF1835 domain-containing protein n=1 Tax=Alteromonas sp. 5E99-2 TaxID=2817683 RepID=UPI001A98C29C|nr:DUF1835 domain-containing protein [Alteromonas sp. 5E99-2]MBO1254389.1 DUF1835 domain-containing protein [Alteromonas sp. 5E99-2]